MDKTKLEKRFKNIFNDKRLLAVQLNGFSHRLVIDSGSKASQVEYIEFSHCMPEGNWNHKAMEFFKDIPNYNYQNNPKEHLFIHPDKR